MSPLQSRLWRLLESEVERGSLVLSDTLKVSRSHYAERLGLSYGFVSAKATSVFKAFDRQIYLQLVRRARETLERALDTGVLPIRDGKVERTWLRTQLGVSPTMLLNRKELRAVAKEFDRKISESGYVPTSTLFLLEKLNHFLENNCPLAVGHKRIAVRELARRIGCTPAMFRQQPFLSAMRRKSNSLTSGVCLRDGDVLVSGKVMEFSSFMTTWPKQFVLRLAQDFQTFALRYDERAKEYRQELVSFLRWLESSTHSACVASRAALVMSQVPEASFWRATLDQYAQHVALGKSERSLQALQNRLGKLNRMLTSFAATGLLPLTGKRLQPRLPSPRPPTPRRSVAEVSRPEEAKADALVAFAGKTLCDSKTRFPSDYQEDGAREFLACLKEEFVLCDSELPHDIPQAVLQVVNARLAIVAEAAVFVIREAQASLEKGRALLSISTLPIEFPDLFWQASNNGAQARAELCLTYFPASTAERPDELAQANLLALANGHFGGVLPGTNYDHSLNKQLGPSFFAKLYPKLGSRKALQDLLTPSQEARAAVLTLHLVDAGANIAVSLGLKGDLMRPSQTRGYTEVVGHKLKAGGRPIYADLRTRGRCITGMQWLWQHCEPLRRAASGENKKLLFISNSGTKFRDGWYRDWFKKLVGSIPKLAGLRITPSMLRPSVLLKAALEHDGSVLFGQALGQHGLNLTASGSYQGKKATRMQWDSHIRGFQNTFESRVLVSANEFATVAGYSAAEVKERISKLDATGLGTFCRNRKGRPGFEGQTCNSLDCIGTSPGEDRCPQMEVVVYPTSAAIMQMWKSSLEKAAPDWERDRAERWEAVWLPWLALLTVVAEKASRGPLLRVWQEGAKLRRAAELEPGYEEPCPF